MPSRLLPAGSTAVIRILDELTLPWKLDYWTACFVDMLDFWGCYNSELLQNVLLTLNRWRGGGGDRRRASHLHLKSLAPSSEEISLLDHALYRE